MYTQFELHCSVREDSSFAPTMLVVSQEECLSSEGFSVAYKPQENSPEYEQSEHNYRFGCIAPQDNDISQRIGWLIHSGKISIIFFILRLYKTIH